MKGARDVTNLKDVLGINVREFRDEEGLTQEALSAEAECTRATITNIEAGRQWPGPELLWNIAEALSVEPADLLELP